MVRAALLTLLCACLPHGISAQGAPRLSLTLAGATETEDACRLSFLAENGLGSDLDALVVEAVIFTRAGAVERLLLLDFRDLPAGKPRVRQFDLAGLRCEALGQILINGVETCEGAGEGACADALETGSRVDGTEVTG